VTCREFAEFLSDYVEGRLAPAVLVEFERHLAECPNCVSYLQNYQETIALGRAAFTELDAVVPREVPDDLVRAILQAIGRPPFSR